MADHDLSALSGLLGDDLDIEEKPSDPRAAKLLALFQHAKATYTAKIDTPTWYIPSSSTPFDISSFTVPTPDSLLAHRKSDRSATTSQEWTANYLYTHSHFENCLSYVVSFALSVGIDFPFKEADGELGQVDSSQMALRRSKREREVSKNWGVIKDVIDVGIRALLALLRINHSTALVWVPSSDTSSDTYKQESVSLKVLAKGFLAFSMREVRVGAGDSRSGYSGMVVSSSEGPKVDMDKVRLQNWTVTPGLTLTAGDLALELGLYRTAIEAHTLFLACRGQMWRVLLALSHELAFYASSLSSRHAVKEETLQALEVVAKASVVSALQAVPRARRLEVARSVMVEKKVIPEEWINDALQDRDQEGEQWKDEDELLFTGLLQPLGDKPGWTVVPEEVGVALVKVVFAKKSGLLTIASKFPTYMKEYQKRIAAADQDFTELDAAEEDDSNTGIRSVRTL